jgi:hypothetical protein
MTWDKEHTEDDSMMLSSQQPSGNLSSNSQRHYKMNKRGTRRQAEPAESKADDHEALMARILDEIIVLLVKAGYFRARIPAISPFDKVPQSNTFVVFLICFKRLLEAFAGQSLLVV